MKKANPPLSRQRRWQLKQFAEGKCITCGKRRKHYARYCDTHGIWARLYQRTRLGIVSPKSRKPRLVPD